MTRQHGPRPDALTLLAHPIDAASVLACVCVLLALSAGAGLLAWWTTARAPEPVAAEAADDDWSCPTCDDADERCPEWEARR